MSKYNAHTNPLFKKYNILKLQDMYHLNCCKIFYRSKIHQLPQYYLDKMPTVASVNPYSRRQSNNIYISLINHSIQKQQLNYKIGNEWNKLSENLKNINNLSLKSFTKKVKKHCIQSYNHACTIRNCFSC